MLILVGFIAAGQHGATAHQMGMRVMHKGVAGFGNLQFNGATGDYQKAATPLVGSGTGETSPSTNDASTPYSVNTYKYTGKDISIPSGNDDIYRFDTTLDSGTLSAFSHVLNTSGDYRPDSFAMVSSDGASRISYSPATGMVDYSQSSGNLATFDVGSLSASPSENPVSHEQALSTAKAFVKEFSISTTGYDTAKAEGVTYGELSNTTEYRAWTRCCIF